MMYFLHFIYYFKKEEILTFKTWDYNSVTASNYTIELLVTEEMWENFKEAIFNDIDLKNKYNIPPRSNIKDFNHIICHVFEE